MKTFIAAIFLLAFTALTFSKAVIYISFYANQNYISKNFCVNIAKPAMNCRGKCQLNKKIKSEESKDRQNQNRKNSDQDEITFLVSSSAFRHPYIISDRKKYPPFSPILPAAMCAGIFRPPSVI